MATSASWTATVSPNASNPAEAGASSDCVVLSLSEALDLQREVEGSGISVQLEEDMDWVVGCIFGNIFYVVSLPTNIINLVVFYKLGLRERINLCLFSLSLADLVFMTTSFVLYIDRAPRLVLGLSRFGSPVFQFMLNNHLTTLYGCSRVSAFISTLIACERCFCVVSPLKAKRLLSTRTMFWIIVVGSTLILIVEYISDLRSNVVCVYNPLTNTSDMRLYPGPLFLKHRQFIEILESVVFGFFMPVCFFCLTILATIITLVRLKQMADWRATNAASQTMSKYGKASASAKRKMFVSKSISRGSRNSYDLSMTKPYKNQPSVKGDSYSGSDSASAVSQTPSNDSDSDSEIMSNASTTELSTISTSAPAPSTKKETQKSISTSSPTLASTSLSSRDAALTRMLIANNILFIVCTSPYFGLNAILPFMPQLSANQTLFAFMVSVYELGGYINATFNFFIFYTMGTRFRETLQSLCRCCGR